MLKTSHFNITTYFRKPVSNQSSPRIPPQPILGGSPLLSPLGKYKLRILNLDIKAKTVNLPSSKGAFSISSILSFCNANTLSLQYHSFYLVISMLLPCNIIAFTMQKHSFYRAIAILCWFHLIYSVFRVLIC